MAQPTHDQADRAAEGNILNPSYPDVILLGQENAEKYDGKYRESHEPSILPRADMIGVIGPARKSELVNRSTSVFEPGQNADAGRVRGAQIRPADLSSAGGQSRVSEFGRR
jgi:hypothetical protein